MKKLGVVSLLVCMCLTLVACNEEEKAEGHATIGVIQYAEHPALDKTYEGFIDALKEEGFEEGKNLTINRNNAQSDSSTNETIADKLVNDNPDLIYAIATPSAQAVAQKTQDIPIVVNAVTDPKTSGIVASNEEPGGNVTGVSDLTPVKEQISLIKEFMPDVKKVAIMYTNSEDNSKFQADIAAEALKKEGIEYQETTVSDISQIQQVAESLVGQVDAVYIPTDNLLAEGIATVTQVTNEKGIPCIVGEKGMTEGGGLASYAIDYYKLGQLAGKQAAKILRGEAVAADMPIEYLTGDELELVINKKVADLVNITIPESLLDKATVLE
ncbi:MULTISPECIES: ABC transporter substrate-binding protein [unclassified Breznakia]|uniref:ABC transporter substrate-binding protein n=1 Tax=unclassified Breznakia TaxID=2623764 RepID=UPI002476CBD2|nr:MULTISPECIES: ABC transporter substrate-binding protein [unclassified Breznakia]MDH6367412.1 putative ABC transport system substrate-binding protein [Breznakia sp. PH1-1]MDH6403944.1 putative ABC transport system substrate-binding protein [Breznakia sp. PF1-11]MDH6411653.1 putative ABC transport system substrate-binding protein [Breznakia sp. PFB1-11]MDH6414579.1 putative ABC transport system substrate-binding protein [Breznakia sp. PFB1-14]MDH6416004.1 putative ABC transport system substra